MPAGFLGAAAPKRGVGCPHSPPFPSQGMPAGFLGAAAPKRGVGCPHSPPFPSQGMPAGFLGGAAPRRGVGCPHSPPFPSQGWRTVINCLLCMSIISKENGYRNGEFASIMPMTIKLPRRTLLVLCGPAASGKSTFAEQRFRETMIVSSDHCRALICDDVTNQQVNRDAFDLFYYIIRK